jgi:diaminohydroxyphosphoribosylaminopyrimidine deaminase/5-amino-6-(5-phosphoribosylamino)uracil reductase
VKTLRTHLDLKRVFARLAELEINEVLVEAGPRLTGALLTAGLVDEWLLYLAPRLLGPHARPLAMLPRLTKLPAAPGFTLIESLGVSADLRLRLRPRPVAPAASDED